MRFIYFYTLSLVNNDKIIKQSINILPEQLRNFAPSMNRAMDGLFLTKWAEDRKKELLSLFGKRKGTFCLDMYNNESGQWIAGSEYITL